MKVEVLYATNTGRLRVSNEDALLINDRVVAGVSLADPQSTTLEFSGWAKFFVADGLGGLPCGDVASRLTLEYIRDSGYEGNSLHDFFNGAVSRLRDFSEKEGRCWNMATALAGVFISPKKTMAINIGDCRVYLLRNGKLELLTRDHTEAFELHVMGEMTLLELREHPLRNFLTSAVSTDGIQDLYSYELEPREGDIFLICSDGFWDEIPENTMLESLQLPLGEAGNCLFTKTHKNGRDNISFIILRVLSLQQNL